MPIKRSAGGLSAGTITKNPALALEDKVLLLYLLEHPDHWIFHESKVRDDLRYGDMPMPEQTWEKALKRLRLAGHVRRQRVSGPNQAPKYELVIYEDPNDAPPDTWQQPTTFVVGSPQQPTTKVVGSPQQPTTKVVSIINNNNNDSIHDSIINSGETVQSAEVGEEFKETPDTGRLGLITQGYLQSTGRAIAPAHRALVSALVQNTAMPAEWIGYAFKRAKRFKGAAYDFRYFATILENWVANGCDYVEGEDETTPPRDGQAGRTSMAVHSQFKKTQQNIVAAVLATKKGAK